MEKGLEGPGKVPRIVQVMYFKGMPRQLNQQAEVGLTQQWEAQWQEFLNTLQPSHTSWGNLQLSDTIPWDDTWAFLAAFEQVAEACQWPREEWVPRLLPALRGGMEQSFCRLDARDRSDYLKVKAAILRADAVRVEMKRQHFRQCCYQELEGPRRVYGQLQELCRQWLKPERHTKEQIVELIIQEQLLGMLPAEIQNWVRECGPKDCVEMVTLVEDFVTGHRPAARSSSWQAPLPEVSVSSQESEGRQRQQHHGASEITSTRNSVLAHQPSTEQGVAGIATTEEPVHTKGGLGLDQKPMHWEVMQESGSSSSALEGLLVPTPELVSQDDQPQTALGERPEQREPVPDALFAGGRIIGEIKIETFQQTISEAEDDFETLPDGEDSSGTTSMSSPEKQLGPRQQEDLQKRKYSRRRRKTFKKKGKYLPSEKNHICPKCGHQSYYYSDLLRHMKSHEAKELYECLECGKKYRGRAYFENHQKTHLPLDDGSSHEGRARTRNSGFPVKEEYTCLKCGIVQSSQSDLTEHMKIHTDDKPYECPECGKLFRWQSNLSRHKGLHTYRRFSPRQLMHRGASDSNKGQSNSAQNTQLLLLGDFSPLSLSAVSDPNPVLRLCPRKSQEVELSRTHGLKTLKVVLKKLPSPQKGKCKGPDCDHRAARLSNLIKGQRVLAGERPYVCPDCGKAFRRLDNRHHQSRACRTQRPISNSILAEETIPRRGEEESRSTTPLLQENIKLEDETEAYPLFSDQPSPRGYEAQSGEYLQGTAAANEASEHQDTNMHSCARCGYQAEKLSDILNHFRTHSEEKPYKCLDCGKSFRWYSALVKHHQTHIASQQMAMPSVVAECDVTLSDDEELINILAAKKPSQHDGGVQKVSEKSSKRSSVSLSSRHRNNLKKSRYDGMEKKHVCLDCGHRTYFLSDLVRHKKSHPNEKPYKCPDCEKIFAQPSFLKLHQKTHKTGRKPVEMKKASQGERKYTCSKCGHKTYKLSTHLLHMRAHVGEGETSYVCDECGKAFKWSSNLSRHKQTHLFKKSFKIRRPSYIRHEEINRDGYELPKKTKVRRKKISGHPASSTTVEIAALREHWRTYKRQQREKVAKKHHKMEESMKENMVEKKAKENMVEKKAKENMAEQETKENIVEKETKENIVEKETKEKNIPEVSLRARLEKFAYSKSRAKEEEPAPDRPNVSAEELHLCTGCGKYFTYDGHLNDHENLHPEAKPHTCQECRK